MIYRPLIGAWSCAEKFLHLGGIRPWTETGLSKANDSDRQVSKECIRLVALWAIADARAQRRALERPTTRAMSPVKTDSGRYRSVPLS